jgi:ABC-type sugar transport system ATPase subunit
MASVELIGITKRYGSVEVIRSLDLTVADGSFCALLGPSGCGKSTMLRMIAGLETVTDGQVKIGDREVTHIEPAKRGVAMVFQSYALYPHLTVAQNICFSLSLAGESKAKQAEAAARVAKMLQLEPLLARRPAELSGGQRQRVAIGRALVRDPKVFLFDEPLSNLDALLRGQMRLELARLHAELGRTMVYVTHDQVEAMTLADKIVVLEKGEISQAGAPLDLYNSPANRFVASFIGSPAMNFLPAIATSAADGLAVRVGDGTLTLPRRGDFAGERPVELGVRPEDFALTNPGDGVIQGRIAVIEALGNTTFVHVDSALGQINVEADPALRLETGSTVGLRLNPEKVHVFDAAGKAMPQRR